MRKKRFLSLLLAAVMTAAAALTLSSCKESEESDAGGGLTADGFSYRATLYGIGDSKDVVLDSLTSAVTDVKCSASWLTATLQPALNFYEHQVISLKSTSDSGDEATVTVTAENGEKATISVRRGSITDGDAYSGANANFITDWWNCDDVNLVGFKDPQYTPWNTNASANIPNNIRFYQGDPKDGWEMAFCYLNDPHLAGIRYFALYNKWTGQVRLYTYIENPTGWGSDLLLNVYFGQAGDRDMYPLYHVHEFGIPTCHEQGLSLMDNAKLLSSQSQTFQTWLSPFTMSRSLTPGWFCFEFDMSGYVPKGKDWLKLKTRKTSVFQVFAETVSKKDVSLKGKLTGTIKGEYTASQVITEGNANATSGILSAISTGFSSIGGFATSGITTGNAYVNLMTNNNVSSAGHKALPVMFWGGFACNVVGAGLSLASDLVPKDDVTTKIQPGKIELALDASLDLDGFISEVTGNSQHSLSVSAEGINSANGANGHMGKGVWGLAEDPVVYIDKEDILSSESSFNLQCTSTGYSLSSFPDYNVRLVYAFDPTSVKLNLNTDLFRDIQDVTVTTNVGVIPNQPYGHTDSYRRMLMLGERPSFRLSQKTSGTININSSNSSVMINRRQKESLADGTYEIETGKDANCSMVTQKKGEGANSQDWQRFYGRLIDLPEIGKQIMVDPQVFIPYTDGNNIGFPTAPDFVVRVEVEFTALDDNGNRTTFFYSKLFIPKIELVGYNDMCNVYNRLKDYRDKCAAGKSINTLANDPKISVKHPNGQLLTDKCIRMLNYVCE